MKNLLLIGGPTASGKTSLAIQLAKAFSTEIISADSRQCFRELGIGVAKPSVAELQEVKHYFINSHSIHEPVDAAVFEQYALAAAEKIFAQHDVAVMVGGTGLYIKAFCEGLDVMPAIPEELRTAIRQDYEANGLMWLQQQVQAKDPQFWSAGEIQNPQRLMRALEMVEATGQSILTFRNRTPAERPFRVIRLALELPREVLYERINQRVDYMMAGGLLQEATALYPVRHINALQTVGYTELFEYLDGATSLAVATDKIKQHTRHYAKRQLTWFRKDPAFTWIRPDADVQDIVARALKQ